MFEFDIIKNISSAFKDLNPTNAKGIGDDCAVIPISETESFIVSTDMLNENVHFLKDKISAQELGHKSLAVNLSDLAAMGAQPVASFLSLGLTKDCTEEWINNFIKGYKNLSSEFNVPLLGGDTTRSDNTISINVTVIGRMENSKIKYRSAAEVGDLICVFDKLGNSAAGLNILLNKQNSGKYRELVKIHHNPIPKINEGTLLSEYSEVHAMMDLSDGIDSDLRHILKASGVGAIVNLDSVPVSETLTNYCKECSLNALETAVTSGEEYTLLFSIKPEIFEELKEKLAKDHNKKLVAIGTITKEKEQLEYRLNGKSYNLHQQGFKHFN